MGRKVSDDSYVHELFEIDMPCSSFDEIVKDVSRIRDIYDIETKKSKSGRITGFVKTKCPIGKTIATSSCFTIAEIGKDDGTIELTVVGGQSSVKNMLDRLEREGVKFRITELSTRNNSPILSNKQEQFLRAAVESGYFEFPKKIKLRQLANRLGVAQSTLNESLRTAQKKILVSYLWNQEQNGFDGRQTAKVLSYS